MPHPHKFTEIHGQVYAVMNWREWDGKSHSFIARKLDPGQIQTYQAMKADGHADTIVFKKLFPDERPIKQAVYINLAEIPTERLASFIEVRFGCSLPSLTRLDRADLVKMFVAFVENPSLTPPRP